MSLLRENHQARNNGRQKRNILFSIFGFLLFSAAILIIRFLSIFEISITRTEIGQTGPIRLVFPENMNQASVTEHISINPDIPLNFKWDVNQLDIWPEELFCAGCNYQLALTPGSETASGKTIKDAYSWQINVRHPEVVYLSYQPGSREIWRTPSDSGEAIQLTETSGQVLDFDIAPDGETIVYSVINAQNGSDLWLVDRNGENVELMLDCQAALCQIPDWKNDDNRIAFVKTDQTGEWIGLVSLLQDGTWVLENDHLAAGTEPHWSPSGDWLAYYATVNDRIEVLDTKDFHLAFTLQSRTGNVGTWFPEQDLMIYQYMQDALFADVELYEADFQKQEVTPLEIRDLEKGFFSRPSIHPDGDWMVIGYHNYTATYSKQLWKISLIGQNSEEITSAHNYSHAAFDWDPQGTKMLYQRLSLDNSQAEPEVWLWNPEENRFSRISVSAGYAAWLP
jgi:Tol biopolymer transport system component